MKIANEMAEKSIRLHVIGCEPSATPYRDFFMALASVTGGKYIPLTNCLHLTEVIDDMLHTLLEYIVKYLKK